MRHFEFSLANNFQPMAFLCGMGHFCTDASHSKEDDDADDGDDDDGDDNDGAVVMITKQECKDFFLDSCNPKKILFKKNCRLCTRLIQSSKRDGLEFLQ